MPNVLYPDIEPFDSAMLDVGDGHQVYYEQCGCADGIPVLFIHGGPASGCSTRHRRFYDPKLYRIVLFDQRGSGKSTPYGEIQHNTTQHLIADIDQLREHLGIDQWLVFGGSWGSALGIAWAAHSPAHCLGLVLRGIFYTGQADMAWFFRDSAQLMPDAWAQFADHVGCINQPDKILASYTKALADPSLASAACAHWMAWEATLSRPGQRGYEPTATDKVSQNAVLKYRLQAAYLSRLCDLDEPAIVQAAGQLSSLPVAIVHGRLDWVCRPINAYLLHQQIAGSYLRLVDQAGHDPFSAGMADALVQATNCFARQANFDNMGADWIN
jgi:proline iminopeptidase